MRAPALACCLPRSIRGKGSTGGARVCSRHSSQPGPSCCCVPWFADCAPRILLWILPYLRNWNTVILGFGLYAFRFCLLATIVIIPQSLSVRGLDVAQFAPAVVWTAGAEVVLAAIAAHLLNQGVDSRLLMALGFATIAVACVVNADYTSAWAAENYFRSELLMGAGQVFAMVGLVSTIVLQALFSGGLDSPYRVLTFSAFFPRRASVRWADWRLGDGTFHRGA